MYLTVLIAPTGFKESLGARAAADAMALGVRRAWPRARIVKTPIVDGGEGFTASLVEATNGILHRVETTGPTGECVTAPMGFLGGLESRTAVIEIAAAAGLSLVPRTQRDPGRTTSFGVGQLIRAALDHGAARIVVGCGDSGVNDGGAGMAQALGARLLDGRGRDIGWGGAALAQLAHIDLSGLDTRLGSVAIDAAVNWHNALLGPRGVTRIYGPQKGAIPEQIADLELALTIYAGCVRDATGLDVASLPGAGASGGIGAGLAGLCGAKLVPRYDLVMRYLDFDARLAEADLVFTAEGSLDGQTPYGKVPAEVGHRAHALGIPVIALAGSIGEDADTNLAHGIAAFGSIITRPCALEEAAAETDVLLASAAEHAARMVGTGMMIAGKDSLGQSTAQTACTPICPPSMACAPVAQVLGGQRQRLG